MPLPVYALTAHAASQMGRRALSVQLIDAIMRAPKQRYAVRSGRDVLQSRVAVAGRVYLIPDIRGRGPLAAGGGFGVPHQPAREVLETLMKVTYDVRTDTLTMVLREDVRVVESDEDKPGVILDYDESGNLVSIEVLDASHRVTETRRVDFQTAE